MTRTKSRAPTNPLSEIWCVDVYEHEKGWGQRLEDHVEFSSEAEATKYATEANARFREKGDADCFASACPPYKRQAN